MFVCLFVFFQPPTRRSRSGRPAMASSSTPSLATHRCSGKGQVVQKVEVVHAGTCAVFPTYLHIHTRPGIPTRNQVKSRLPEEEAPHTQESARLWNAFCCNKVLRMCVCTPEYLLLRYYVHTCGVCLCRGVGYGCKLATNTPPSGVGR